MYYEIMAQDPGGKPWKPTKEDYDHFKAWVIETYGHRAWLDYWGSEGGDW